MGVAVSSEVRRGRSHWSQAGLVCGDVLRVGSFWHKGLVAAVFPGVLVSGSRALGAGEGGAGASVRVGSIVVCWWLLLLLLC